LETNPRMAPEQRGGGDAGGLAAAERADAPGFEPWHVRRKEWQEVTGRGGAGEREPPEHVENGGLLERDQPPFHHRPKAVRFGGRVKDDLRPDSHLFELAQEYAEILLVPRLGSQLS